jgi:hypothetical protein
MVPHSIPRILGTNAGLVEREDISMQMIQSGYRGLSLVFDLSIDRILIPLAIVVGLAGGAMIGSEIAKLQVPPSQFMR